MAKRVTLKEIAAETGLSMMTVSKYVNGVRIRPENARLIEAALQKFRYEPNIAARNLRMNRSMTIGILISSLSDLFGTRIIKGAAPLLEEKGYGIIVCDYNEQADRFEQRLSFLRAKQIDGLITMAPDNGGPLLSRLQEELPVIQMDYPLVGFSGDVVLCDHWEASRQITRLMLRKGYRRIGIIAGKRTSYTARECVRGCCDALLEAGIFPDSTCITYGDYSEEGGERCARQLLSLKEPPEVLYVTNEAMACGMLRLFQQQQLLAGRDIAVAGRDLLRAGEVYVPRITSVEQPLEQLGAEASKLLLRRLDGDRDGFPSRVLLKSRLIEGDSL